MLLSTTQIAKEVGCSQQTVSRILNGKAQMHRPELVKKVQQLAKKNDYRPNYLANGLLRGRTQTVGVMVPIRDDAFYSRVVTGIHNELSQANVLPLLSLASERITGKEQILRLIERRVDGIIIRPMFERLDESYLADIKAANIPVVAINRPPDTSVGIDYVGSDDYEGGALAARHLMEFGHKRAAFVYLQTPVSEKKSPIHKRMEGFRDVFEKVEGNIFESVEIAGDSFESSLAGKTNLLEVLGREKSDRPTAIFLAFDQLAWGVYAAANELNLSIPNDISVVGFSDQPFSKFSDPPLTTICQGPEAIGVCAAQLLLDRIEGRLTQKSPVCNLLKPALNVRKSSVTITS